MKESSNPDSELHHYISFHGTLSRKQDSLILARYKRADKICKTWRAWDMSSLQVLRASVNIASCLISHKKKLATI